MSDLWAQQTSMQRALGTSPQSGDTPADKELSTATTPYAAQLQSQSQVARWKSMAQPAVAGAADKINGAISDVLGPLNGALPGG